MRTPCELDEEIVVQNILYIVMLIGVVAVTLVKGCMLIIDVDYWGSLFDFFKWLFI